MGKLQNIPKIMPIPHSCIVILHSSSKTATVRYVMAAYSDHVVSDLCSFGQVKMCDASSLGLCGNVGKFLIGWIWSRWRFSDYSRNGRERSCMLITKLKTFFHVPDHIGEGMDSVSWNINSNLKVYLGLQ